MYRQIISIILFCSVVFASEPVREQAIPGEVIVKLAPNTQLLRSRSMVTGLAQLDILLNQYGVSSVEPMFPTEKPRRSDLPDISRIYRVRYAGAADPRTVAAEMSKLPGVVYAEPNLIMHEMDVPDDSLVSEQWHIKKINAYGAWDISHGDTSVLIAIVDGSFDLQHKDLKDNWFTNWAELNGTPGEDDDGNGYIDDIRGWDFAYDDNDPGYGDPGNTHGTHVAGILNAVTNNLRGISGVAWNVRMLPLKCGLDELSTSIINGYSAIVYAAEMGADVINNSWGGGGYTQYGEDVVAYATGLGALVIGAAGNENSSGFFSPGGLRNVLNVAATSSSDKRASFSNYGLTVDVAAPGESILSTLTQNEYGYLSGTSMASPVVTGLAALVKSVYPDLSPYELAYRIAGTTVNIDGLNPDYVGMLGSGRVNAYQAVTFDTSQFVEILPRIDGWKVSTSDAVSGNNNGILDRGEKINVSGVFRNFSLADVNNFSIRLTSSNPDLIIVDSTSASYSLAHDSEITINNELSFLVTDSAEAGMADLNVEMYVDGTLHRSHPLKVLIGKTPVLIVDDDGGNIVEGFYTGILDEQGIKYGVWDHDLQGSPSANVLKAFPIVIWICEWAFPGVDDNDRSGLRQYLDNGGNLYLSGQDVGWDLNLNPGTDDQKSFFRDYLHAVWGGDDADVKHANGIPGDPIGDGLSFDFWQPGYPPNYQYPDYFSPDDDAYLSFEYSNGLGMGLRYAGDYKVVYTGIGLETFDSNLGSIPPDNINDTQRTALTRILSYLNFINHTAYTDVEDTTSNFDVAITITGDISDLESVKLFYKSGPMTDFTGIAMADSGLGRFVGTIPAPNAATEIKYFVKISTEYYGWTNPVGSPENAFRFYAGPDTIPPVVLSVNALDSRIDRSGVEEIVAYTMDNIGIDSVFLQWSTSLDPDSVRTIPMNFDGQAWKANLVWENLLGGTVVSYWIKAVDASSNHNQTISDPMTFRITNTTRVTRWEEQDITGWDTGDGWGLQYINSVIGYGMNDSPGGQYANNADNRLTILNPIDLSPYNRAYLQFWNGAFLRTNEDFGYVELSDDGTNWTTVSSITGMNVVKTVTFDVTDYIDTGVYIRFRMTSDDKNTAIGWFVDDIQLLVDTTIVVATQSESDNLPTTYSLSQNYPNPFNPLTRIQFALPAGNRVSLVIYDLLGREIKTLVNEYRPAGRYEIIWNATNESGSPVGAGMYFYRLATDSYTKTRKMVLLK